MDNKSENEAQVSELNPKLVKELNQHRSNIKAQLTRFQTFLNNFSVDNKCQLSQLQHRLVNVEGLLDKFNDIHIQLLTTDCDDHMDDHLNQLQEFEDQYYELVAIAREFTEGNSSSKSVKSNNQGGSQPGNDLPQNNEVFQVVQQRSSVEQDDANACLEQEREQSVVSVPRIHRQNQSSYVLSQQPIKLPVIELPTFSGRAEEWLQFFDTFDTLIHSNEALSEIQKFYYLKSSLKGDAEQVIHSLEVSARNYEIAWSILKERYQNNKLIIHNHVRALFDHPVIPKESHIALRKLLDETIKNLRVLKSFDQPVDTWDTILVYLLTTKLDSTTKREWESINITNDAPTFDNFVQFLTARCQLLETLHSNKDSKVHSEAQSNRFHQNKGSFSKSFIASNQEDNKNKCFYCKNLHYIFFCSKFLDLPVKLRIQEIKKLKLCFNCLKPGHGVETCRSSGCKTCNKKHNSLLHIVAVNTQTNPTQSNDSQAQSTDLNNQSQPQSTTAHSHHSNGHKSDVLLSTAIVLIIDKSNKSHEARALLDSGSQSNFMSRSLCDKLNLQKQKIQIPVSGLNQNITNINQVTTAKLQSRCNSYQFTSSFLILDNITENLPSSEIDIEHLNIPNNIILADNRFNKPSSIELLLGATVFYDLMCIGQIKLGKDQPILQKTKLGWVISGNTLPNNYLQLKRVCHFSRIGIQEQLEKFWKLEDVSKEEPFSGEEKECELEFQQQHKRRPDGHFVVPILKKKTVTELGDSLQTALKRFSTLESKLAKDDGLKAQYVAFMQEYEELGHMTKIKELNASALSYYLPHHGIVKAISTTTAYRVVYDGSCKTDSGISLNDVLKVGPKLQQDLFSILIRFRKHNVVIAGDIEKMYRQVYIREEERDLQRIVWRASPDQDIGHYQLNTATYGTASASYLAIRSLQQVGIDNKLQHPQASKAIMEDFYVDDLLSGSCDIESAIQLKHDLQILLNQYGFNLRKWNSNRKEVLSGNSINHVETLISDSAVNKTLGLCWRADEDTLQFFIDKIKPDKVTKRIILSTISQIFDPLGLLGPCVVKAKVIIQRLWKLDLDWDESVPNDLHTSWMDFITQLEYINTISILRHVISPSSKTIQIHGFCDASELAYGACIYIRSSDQSDNHTVRLLCSKSRVAPVKIVSIPKLELSGALLLAKLMRKVIDSIDVDLLDSQIYYWTDSTIVLSWIAGQPYHWKTFVANRVSEIQGLSKINQWRYINTKNNPADIISRGLNPNDLINSKLWWNGTAWLAEDQQNWPKSKFIKVDEIPEQRTQIVSMTTYDKAFSLFNRYSSLLKLQRVVAYLFRFRHNATNHENKRTGPLEVIELKRALNSLIKLAQREAFEEEISSLIKQKPIKRNSGIVSLNPILDDDQLIRVGGRIRHADSIQFSQKHPIILPKKHILTKLIIKHAHYKSLHSGPQALLSIIRTNYWPISGRSVIKSILKNCVVCFRTQPVAINHLMGDLPKERVTPARPFLFTGLDYAGPFLAKPNTLRKAKITKVYLCIFVCLSTKATHLELVHDLSTDSFLNCLKRFIGRRGKPVKLFSDNATNFVGASHELQNFVSHVQRNFQHVYHDFLASESIKWKFIPANSPHFGGLWEAAVKSAKSHLKRVTGNLILTYDNLNTVMIQIEACLNSRPLTPLTSNPSDFQALTPGHFLIGSPLLSFYEPDVSGINSNRLSQYQHLTQIIQHFWTRWSSDYINELQCRTKWKSDFQQLLQPGSLVLIKDNNLPPLRWKMGRVTKVFPGQDNVIRVASVKTSSGEVTRAVSRLCVLPLDDL